ncbi:unnamed protein product [Sphagnum troendelagicum]|uniref:(S)-2-hydroxy-acid oxidase n=1 Tax=Sphagnum troendelagicum TaxID=128251 RepID=A0ABP0UE96_9BRYO
MSKDVVKVDEFEALAKKKMPKMAFDYYASGAEDEHTLQQNREAFSRIRLRPRILVDVSSVNTSTTVLGFRIAMPIMVAPAALHKLAHPEGEVATARAVSAADTIMILSTTSSCSMEEVAAAAPGVRFFQLYVYKDRKISEHLVRRAEDAGFSALVLTVDTPRLGRREADLKNKSIDQGTSVIIIFYTLVVVFSQTGSSMLASWADKLFDRSLSWKDVKWLKSITKLPIILKGILNGEDAILAVQAGAAGIMVSNHGARQLDYVPPTISILEEVVKAVGGQVPVFLDGGIRRGTDVFKALALGASGVFVGRPSVFGLAVDGEAGVKKMLEMLRDELERTMTLMGVCSVDQISRHHVETEYEYKNGCNCSHHMHSKL